MHQFLYLRLHGFYSRALTERDPLLAAKRLAIHRDKQVLDVNECALTKLVYPCMSLSEAKAIVQDGTFVAWEEEPYRAAQSEWLDLCTEVSDHIEPDQQHTAWIDLSDQPDAEALAMRLRRTISNRLGLRSSVGLGCSKWIARLACEVRRPEEDALSASISMREPITKPASFLAPLKTQLLLPVQKEHRTRLEFLGYATIGEVARVPLSVLRSQFGDAATHIRMCARGGYFEPVQALYPPNSISERMSFDGIVEDLQTLDEGLKLLAANLSQRLKNEDRQGKELTLTLEHEDFATTVLRRTFSKPIHNYASALAALRLLISGVEQPVQGLRARLDNVTETKRIQQELAGRVTSSDHQRGAASAFQHIRTAFGDGAIVTGSEIIEPRRKQVLRAWKDATGWA